jgi:hypothetical protein
MFSIAAVKCFLGAYVDSSKECDMAFWPKGSSSPSSSAVFPTIVLESGWSESWENLCDDRELWAEGTGYAVNLVILVKLFLPSDDAGATGQGGGGGAVGAKLEIKSYNTQGSTSSFSEVGSISAYTGCFSFTPAS